MNIDQLILHAIHKNASDVHILIKEDVALTFIRCYGKLTELPDIINAKVLCNRIKVLADLNIAETRRIQEGQFNFVIDQHVFCIRVSIMKSDLGEKIAMRILSPLIIRTLENLGMPITIESELLSCLKLSQGLILVCGATGSGKTTTLYSCIDTLRLQTKNIFTIEDPVERQIKNIYQFEPNPHLGINTHDLLKGFLRQDPDVIMVGEIRDAETANLAISAALTGHLVLASLHTNSALNVIHRCKHWNVDYFAFASTIKLIIHQTMQFSENGQQAKFAYLKPRWMDSVPENYDTLIKQSELWQSS